MRFTPEEEKAVLERSGIHMVLTSEMLAELRTRYSEPHRHYHVWDHALQVLSWVNFVCEDAQFTTRIDGFTPMDLKLAALFHDAVYDALKGSPSNEAASCEVLHSFGLSVEIGRVEEITLATARHGKTRPGDLPMPIEWFLDCDIAHFGEKRWEIVRWNDDNISREYEVHYSKEEVAAGRKKFLEGMIAGDRPLYMSGYFRNLDHGMFERQAQHNLRRLIREAP